jgi:hypothetical protein
MISIFTIIRDWGCFKLRPNLNLNLSFVCYVKHFHLNRLMTFIIAFYGRWLSFILNLFESNPSSFQLYWTNTHFYHCSNYRTVNNYFDIFSVWWKSNNLLAANIGTIISYYYYWYWYYRCLCLYSKVLFDMFSKLSSYYWCYCYHNIEQPEIVNDFYALICWYQANQLKLYSKTW